MKRFGSVFFTGLFLLFTLSSVQADDFTWFGGSGNWNSTGVPGWNTNHLPTAADFVNINNNVTVNDTTVAAEASNITVGYSSAGSLIISGGSLTNYGATFIGRSGVGTVQVSGGEWSSGLIAVGSFTNGSLNISGGTVYAEGIILGTGGAGSLRLTGGVLETRVIINNNVSEFFLNGGTIRSTESRVLFDGFDSITLTGTWLASNRTALVLDTVAGVTSTATNDFSFVRSSSSTTRALEKTGAGTLELSGNTDLTADGDLYVNGGTLSITGSLTNRNTTIGESGQTATMNVAAGGAWDSGGVIENNSRLEVNGLLFGGGSLNNAGTLAGSGTINQVVAMDADAVLDPGSTDSPVGTLTFTQAQTWTDGFTYNWDMGSAAPAGTGDLLEFDSVTLTLSDTGVSYTLNINDALASSAVDDFDMTWKLITSAGIYGFDTNNWTITGDTAFMAAHGLDGWFEINLNGNDLVLNYHSNVPEPFATALVLWSAALCIMFRRYKYLTQ